MAQSTQLPTTGLQFLERMKHHERILENGRELHLEWTNKGFNPLLRVQPDGSLGWEVPASDGSTYVISPDRMNNPVSCTCPYFTKTGEWMKADLCKHILAMYCIARKL